MTESLLDPRVFESRDEPKWEQRPVGRPPQKYSITYWYRRMLEENDGQTAREIATAVIERAKQASMPHVVEITTRLEGNVASQLNVQGVFLHVGDEYASQGLAAMREDMSNKQLEASQMPQISNSSPANGQMGIQLPPGGNDPIKIDE